MLTVVKSKPVCFLLSIYPSSLCQPPPLPSLSYAVYRLAFAAGLLAPTQLQVLLQGQFAVCAKSEIHMCVVCVCVCVLVAKSLCVCV